LEHYLHPEGVQKLAHLEQTGLLTLLYANERSIIYAVPGRLAQTQQGFYAPVQETAMR